MPDTIEYLSDKARTCREFAMEMRCRKTANGLRNLAAQYDQRAERLRRGMPTI